MMVITTTLNSLAKSNCLPYGDLIGLPPLPPFAITFSTGRDILNGVNYASAAAGILDETGKYLGDRYALSQQIQNFTSTLSQLKTQMEDKKLIQYLAKSLVIMNVGSNDCINNYLLPSMYSTSFNYNPKDYADLPIKSYTEQLSVLHGLGLRKFLLAAVGPLGCIPNQLATGVAPPGKCVSFVNDMVEIFNMPLKSTVDQLNKEHTQNGTVFVYGNTYKAFFDLLNNLTSYGKYIDI
ncbi:GDSL esterase/lipase At5g08460-like [Hevea brasiliensis]|uniref:GDSL esterase/lipase At5g08460-like n=2 Tax=Hevea brasiliensis TaxID=3981 RepID=UPI0025F72BC0|nr:GDSL esterase/lipase At5g08460-like [Hevea brasiliensis]